MEDRNSTPRAEAPIKLEVSYLSLPHKRQLFVLLLARLTESLAASSIQSYMFFQLQYFDPTASASSIATQSGLIIGSKTAAHVCTGLVWGRLADHRRIGRKRVLVIGLLASSLSMLGYGYSESFKVAITWQVLDGALSSIVAMVRCMVSELNPEKRHRSRALALLPLSANLGSLFGPLIGGFLASTKSTSAILSKHPYAAPNICVASIQGLSALCVIYNLDETMENYETVDHQHARAAATREFTPTHVQPLRVNNHSAQSVHEASPLLQNSSTTSPVPSHRFPHLRFSQMWTPNVLSTMLAQHIISGHLGTFSSLWAVFLSMPVAPSQKQHMPFHFSGGLGLQPRSVGMAMSLLGFAGIILQIMIYPILQERFGTIRLWRAALCVFPVVYTLAPFCALFASLSIDEKGGKKEIATSSSPTVWAVLLSVLGVFVAGRTCVVPATSLLINDCTPHPSVRGTVHTTGVVSSNLSRSIFPPITFAVFGLGLRIGTVGLGFWFVAGLAILGCAVSWWVVEGTNGNLIVQ